LGLGTRFFPFPCSWWGHLFSFFSNVFLPKVPFRLIYIVRFMFFFTGATDIDAKLPFLYTGLGDRLLFPLCSKLINSSFCLFPGDIRFFFRPPFFSLFLLEFGGEASHPLFLICFSQFHHDSVVFLLRVHRRLCFPPPRFFGVSPPHFLVDCRPFFFFFCFFLFSVGVIPSLPFSDSLDVSSFHLFWLSNCNGFSNRGKHLLLFLCTMWGPFFFFFLGFDAFFFFFRLKSGSFFLFFGEIQPRFPFFPSLFSQSAPFS